jgi:hypothetical protein
MESNSNPPDPIGGCAGCFGHHADMRAARHLTLASTSPHFASHFLLSSARALTCIIVSALLNDSCSTKSRATGGWGGPPHALLQAAFPACNWPRCSLITLLYPRQMYPRALQKKADLGSHPPPPTPMSWGGVMPKTASALSQSADHASGG